MTLYEKLILGEVPKEDYCKEKVFLDQAAIKTQKFSTVHFNKNGLDINAEIMEQLQETDVLNLSLVESMVDKVFECPEGQIKVEWKL